MESDAEIYSKLHKPQYDIGCDFISALNLSKGTKVVDMGYGTGELTKFIADLVGHTGEVVGVDPDEARIKIAQEKFKKVDNVPFVAGNSVIGFPHDNGEYYDLHFSNTVFNWVLGEEKKLYLKKAHQCLKPGGRTAIQSAMKTDTLLVPKALQSSIEVLGEEEYKQLVKDVERFNNVETTTRSSVSHFVSMDEFAAWLKASTHKKFDELKDWVKPFLSTEPDG